MNQILVTKKLYITPELKRKKKAYKFDFIISIFLICILASCYIYAEYDRNKNEAISREVLANLSIEGQDNTVANTDILTVILNSTEEDEGYTTIREKEEVAETPTESQTGTSVQSNENSINKNVYEYNNSAYGYNYAKVGSISIPKIGVNYSIVKGATGTLEETEALLKMSPCEFWGYGINEVGNYCITGHNYRNKKFFSKVPTLVNGDIIEITGKGETVKYAVYDKYEVDPKDNSCTSQLTNGNREITLITCTDDSSARVIVKAREVKG